MFKVGLTGGIGSGKTTVASLFHSLGVPTLDMDDIAKELTQWDQPGFHLMINRFGQSIVKDKQLDRKMLREIIFSDPAHLQWIKDHFHPLILNESSKRLQKLTAPYAVVVIPLLIEDELMHYVDRIVVVDLPETQQIERASKRDNVTQASIIQIMEHQVTRTMRLQFANDLIENTGTLDDLKQRVAVLHQQILSYAKTT